MPFYQVNLASGKSVVVEASSAYDAKTKALQEHGANDPREEVIEIVDMGDSPKEYQGL